MKIPLFVSLYNNEKLPPFIIIRSNLSGDEGTTHLRAWTSSLLKQLNLSSRHPDILLLKKGEKEKTWKVSSMEQLNTFQNHRPHSAPHRLVFFEEAHLIEEKLCNKLLKSLEEPREWISIVFLTSGTKRFLPTVESRAVTFFIYDKRQKKDTRVNLLSSYLSGKTSEHALMDRLTGNKNKQREFLTQLILHKKNHPLDFKDADLFLENLKWFTLAETYQNPLPDRFIPLLRGLWQ